jgi:cytochrome P450
MGSGFLKAKWYERLMLGGTLVCIVPSKEHAARRKHFSRAFSQQNLLEWESVIRAKVAFRVAAMKNEGHEGKAVNILAHFKSMATEVVIELCYGESTDAEQASIRKALVQGIRNELLLSQSERAQNLPFYLKWIPLPISKLLLNKFAPGSITQPKLQLARSDDGHKQTLLSKALAENEAGAECVLPWPVIVKEAIAFIVAGTDTTAVTATYLIWTTLKHPEVHGRLRKEVKQLSPELTITELQSLPYLQCVIQETLRLYGAVSSGLPRRTPKGGCQVGEIFVPEGTTVTTQSFTLHLDSDIFEDPLK